MRQPSKVTPVGKTAHFEVSYLTTLGKRGDTLAHAIVENCERDYAVMDGGEQEPTVTQNWRARRLATFSIT